MSVASEPISLTSFDLIFDDERKVKVPLAPKSYQLGVGIMTVFCLSDGEQKVENSQV